MLIGNGLLASAFHEYKDDDSLIIFASGVSNSKETDPNAFKREETLLLSTIESYPEKKFVYFSTTSVEDESLQKSPYVIHKLKVEQLIREKCDLHLIFRLSNIVGKGGNQKTIFNFLASCVKEQQEIEIWQHATRNLLDIKHAFQFVNEILKEGKYNDTVNIANNQTFKVPDILDKIETYLEMRTKRKLVDKGIALTVDTNAINHLFDKVITPDQQSNYLLHLLKSYF